MVQLAAAIDQAAEEVNEILSDYWYEQKEKRLHPVLFLAASSGRSHHRHLVPDDQ